MGRHSKYYVKLSSQLRFIAFALVFNMLCEHRSHYGYLVVLLSLAPSRSEFTMAEIEHFVAPHRKEHAKFDAVKGMRLTLFPGTNQIGDGRTLSPTLEEAVRGWL